MIYGAKEKLTHKDDTNPPLYNQGTKLIQGVVGALLYYARALYNRLLIGLSSIGSQRAAATEYTNEEINQILDYCCEKLCQNVQTEPCHWSDSEFHWWNM